MIYNQVSRQTKNLLSFAIFQPHVSPMQEEAASETWKDTLLSENQKNVLYVSQAL